MSANSDQTKKELLYVTKNFGMLTFINFVYKNKLSWEHSNKKFKVCEIIWASTLKVFLIENDMWYVVCDTSLKVWTRKGYFVNSL